MPITPPVFSFFLYALNRGGGAWPSRTSAGNLTNLEVLHDEVVALVELSVVIGELLQLEKNMTLGDGLHYFHEIFDNLRYWDFDDQFSGPILACGMIFATSTISS